MTMCQKTGGFELQFLVKMQEHNYQSGDIDNIDKYIHLDDIIVAL